MPTTDDYKNSPAYAAMTREEREYSKWVRDSVVAPTIKKWGAHAWGMFGQEIREEFITAECMRVVLGWARSSGEVENAAILKFYREAMRLARPEE
jgi:hypothetical protein